VKRGAKIILLSEN